MIAIINAVLVMRDHLIPNGAVFIKDGKIFAFGEMRQLTVPEGCQILDAKGAYVGPGLVDIHTHAGGGHWFYEDPYKAAKVHMEHGVTTVLPTLYFSMTAQEILKGLKTIQAAKGKPGCKNIAGFYMEAPYMNPNFGCDREKNPWKGPIRREEYQPIIDQAGEDVKVWVLAPERENIRQFVLDAKQANPDVRFAVGHSEASPQQIEALMPYGLSIGTHHTNATGNREKYPECRGVCVDETVNYHRDIYAELICDSRGIHVDPYMLRLVRRIKGEDRVILISDACVFDGPVPEGYEGVKDILFDYAGEIAGTKLTLDVACQNMMVHTGASIVDVFRYASYNPARAVGLYDRGELAVGKRADLVITDHKMNIKTVILEGEIQK